MKHSLKKIYFFILKLGFDPLKLLYSIKSFIPFFVNYLRFRKMSKSHSSFNKISINAQLFDLHSDAGDVKTHYFWQDLIVAKKINDLGIKLHNDIGSRIDGFIAHLASSNIIVNIFDIRKLEHNIPNVNFTQLDLMNDIPKDLEHSCHSLSCLHTLEHFGLGRYGDDIDTNGYIKGLNQMNKLVKKNGYFFLSVPVGKQRVEFNAHRVFDPHYIYSLLKKDFHLNEFVLIDDNCNVKYYKSLENNKFSELNYSCGIFIFKKK